MSRLKYLALIEATSKTHVALWLLKVIWPAPNYFASLPERLIAFLTDSSLILLLSREPPDESATNAPITLPIARSLISD